jgi:hypothetical protein
MIQLQVNRLIDCFAIIFGILLFTLFISHSFAQEVKKIPSTGKTTEILISEIVHTENSSLNYVELYNPSDVSIDLSSENYYLSKDNISSISNVALSGIIEPNGTFVCSVNYTWFFIYFKWFLWEYGIDPDQQNNSWTISSTASFMLYKGGDSNTGTLVDVYGEVGEESDHQAWDYTNAHAVRKRSILNPSSIWKADEWVIVSGGSNQMSPGQHAADVQYVSSTGSWNTRGSWSSMGYVPDASCNVEILSNQILSVDASSSCNQLTIHESAQLSISAGQDFQVVDSIINNEGVAGLVLNSNASGCSSLIHHSQGAQATMDSYFSDLDLWYFVASPMVEAMAGVFYGQYLTYWDEPNASWMYIYDENRVLQPGEGLSLKKSGTNTTTYQGTLNNGTILIDSLRFTASNEANLRGWNLIGNPYPSVLDFNEVDVSGTAINAGISVWPHNGNQVSAYMAWSQGGGFPVGEDEARYIQPGQGFMIQVSSDMQSFELTNDCRTHTGLGVFDKSTKTTTNQEQTLVFEIYGENTTTDKTFFAIREEADIEFELEYDIRKMFGAANHPHIFSYGGVYDEEKLAINCIGYPEEGKEYSLGTQLSTAGVYYLKISGKESFENEKIYLKDELENQIYDLDFSHLISFYYQSGEPEKRFKLLFDTEVDINNMHLKTSEVSVFVRNNRLYLSGCKKSSDEVVVQVFDLLGQVLLEQNMNMADNGVLLDLSSAYYVVSVLQDQEATYHKVFIPSGSGL